MLDPRALVAALVASLLVVTNGFGAEDVVLSLELESQLEGNGEIFYAAPGESFVAHRSVPFAISHGAGAHRYSIRLPGAGGIQRIRVDPGTSPGRVSIGSLSVQSSHGREDFAPRKVLAMSTALVQAELASATDAVLLFESLGTDPSIEIAFERPLAGTSRFMRSMLLLVLAFGATYLSWWGLGSLAARAGRVPSPRLDRFCESLSDARVLVVDRGVLASVALLLAAAGLYVCLNLNQSSIGIWERVFPNAPIAQAIELGDAKVIRSDEWTVQTPWALNQVHAGFPRQNPNIGGESAPILAAMPVNGILGFPQAKFWGFHLFTPDRGFSWWWAYKSFALIGAFLWMLLLLTRGNLAASWLGSLWVYGSSFTQWWFSSSLPEIATAFALAVVGAIYALHSQRRGLVALGCVLVMYAFANLLLHLYPPAIVPLAYLGMLLLAGHTAARFGTLDVRRLAGYRTAALGLTGALLAAYVYTYYQAAESSIRGVMETVYPGRRVSASGQFTVAKLASGFFEWYRLDETHLPLKPTNGSEASSFLWLSPLVPLLVRWRSLLRGHVAPLTATLCFLAACLCWVVVPLPAPLERIMQLAGWQYVTSKRAVFVLGIASIIACTLALDIVSRRPADRSSRAARLAAVVVTLVLVPLLGGWLARLDPAFFTGKVIALGTASAALIAWGLAAGRTAPAALGLALAMAATLTVNPLTTGLTSLTAKPVLAAARLHSTPDSRWMIVGEPFLAQGLKALGLNVFGGYLYQPDQTAAGILDPGNRYANSWNRYARVRVSSRPALAEPTFRTTHGDQYTVELDICGRQVRALGITHVAYTGMPPGQDRACLEALEAPPGSGVGLFRLRGN